MKPTTQDIVPEQSSCLSLDEIQTVEAEQGKRNVTAIVAGTVAAGAAVYVSYKFGNNLIDARLTPDVPVVDTISQGITATSDTLRELAPAVAIATGAGYAAASFASRKDNTWLAAKKMSETEYAGTATGKRSRNKWLRMIAGTAIPATVLIAAAAGIEHEVSDGPTRAIDKAISTLSPDGQNTHFIVQNPETQFMNNSYVSKNGVGSFVQTAADHGVTALPFRRELPNITDSTGRSRTALMLGVPTPIFERISGQSNASTDCAEVPVVVDDAANVSVGDKLLINNQNSRVVATVSGASSMNRISVIQDEKTVAKCIQKNPDAPYYGVAVSGKPDAIQAAFDASTVKNESSLVTAEQLKDFNRKFWQNNGTPILLQMMGYIAAFGYIANRNEKRASLQNSVRELGTLNAGGVSVKDIHRIETMKAVKETGVAAAVAVVAAPAFAAVINAAEWGLQTGISAREIAVGFTLTLFAKMFGARRAVRKFGKQLTPAEAMKG